MEARIRPVPKGGTENERPDIARLDNAAPYRNGGHRETCFSVHHKFMFDAGVLYELLIGFMFVVLFLSVLLIATCGRL